MQCVNRTFWNTQTVPSSHPLLSPNTALIKPINLSARTRPTSTGTFLVSRSQRTLFTKARGPYPQADFHVISNSIGSRIDSRIGWFYCRFGRSGRLSLLNMFNVLNQLELANGNQRTIAMGHWQISQVGMGLKSPVGIWGGIWRNWSVSLTNHNERINLLMLAWCLSMQELFYSFQT